MMMMMMMTTMMMTTMMIIVTATTAWTAFNRVMFLQGLEQQLGSVINDAAAAGADVQGFTDVLQGEGVCVC